MTQLERRNKRCFGLGTIERDMFYSMESMFFLTEIRDLDGKMLALGHAVYLKKRGDIK